MTDARNVDSVARKLRDLKSSQFSLASSDRAARPISFETSAPIYLSATERDALLQKIAPATS